MTREQFSYVLTEDLLTRVVRPGQYLGNEWGARRAPWDSADIHLALTFPDLYELGMSNFGLRILYQIVNARPGFLADRSYAPDSDLEALLRERQLPLWGWESRYPLKSFELVGFSLQYELTYTNVLNMLDLADIPVLASERKDLFPLVFGGGPSAVNPEPMARFMDFFVIGDGEEAVPAVMDLIRSVKTSLDKAEPVLARQELLSELAAKIPGIYVPSLYSETSGCAVVKPLTVPGKTLPERVLRQVQPLTDDNQPTGGLVPYLSLVHDRQVLEVRRGCDRGCRFCQPGYTFLPVRERSAEDLVRLSKEGLEQSGHQEYSMLSLCVSDYTSLHDAVRALNREHSSWRASMSFPSQRADRMNLDLAEELKAVRRSGITLAPEAGSERLRAVINKGLSHAQIISAIEAAYQSGWSSIKLYFMLGLPTETDEDLYGIVDILAEATERCRAIRRDNPDTHHRLIEFTCTISNFVPKPFTPFQWYGQIDPKETERRHRVLKESLKESGLRNVQLNFTEPQISLLEAVISRGDRRVGEIIYRAWRKGCRFDAWDDRFKPEPWHEVASELGVSLVALACRERPVGSRQPWDIVHIGLNDWWLVKEWEKAIAQKETAPCTEHVCHACGVCTELDTTHLLAAPKPEVVAKNPFVKELAGHDLPDSHPSLFFMKPEMAPGNKTLTRIRFQFNKSGEMRFISHLDLQHLMARAARRAKLAVAFSEGFNPAPKLSLAVSLPLFQEGEAEVGEVDLAQAIEPEEFLERLNSQLPAEVRLTTAKVVARGGSALATCVGRAKYGAYPISPDLLENTIADATTGGAWPAIIKERITEILSQSKIELAVPDDRQGRKKNARGCDAGNEDSVRLKDVRPGIFHLSLAQESPPVLALELAAGAKLHVKPTEVLKLINPDVNWRVTRLGLATPDGIPLFDIP